MIIKIISTSRDMVGDLATIRAEIHEQRAGFTRVRDTIEINVEGGARMNDTQLIAAIEEVYHG
jgi:hypothetical protein